MKKNQSKPKSKKTNNKYWYSTDVYCCVLCGKENRYKARVYNENEKGIKWHDDMCWEHKF